MTRSLKIFVAALLALAFSGAVWAQDANEAIYVVIHVDVYPTMAAQGDAALKQFAVESRKDTGAMRFEVLQEPARKNHFTLVEVWQSQQAYDGHVAAEHTRQFRERFQPLLASPFDERLHRLDQ